MNTIEYKRINHIIREQKEREDAFLKEFSDGSYTLKNPLIVKNPYLIAPLTAMILFKSPVSAEATIIIHGKEKEGNIVHRFSMSKDHILPIYGLYANYENNVEIILSTGETNTIYIQTDPLDTRVHEAFSCINNGENMYDNMMFMTASMRSLPVAYDYRGDVRWYSSFNFAFDLKRISNGHLLVGTERLVEMPYYTTGIYELSVSGKIFKEYRIPGGYHHDHFLMPDGNILILTENLNSSTVEDMCVLIDKESGEILKSWDYKNVLPQYPIAGSGTQSEEDWFHNNSVWYDEKNNSLILSGRHQDAVISIDFDTGDLNWILGDPEGWPQEYVDKYFFTPVGDLKNFDWQYEQHSAMVLPNGNIFLFDNGHWRSKVKEKYWPNSKNFSRGVIYRINTDKMEIEQVCQYGKERGAEFFSPYICNVDYYEEGHYLVHSGGIGLQNGQTCEGMAVNLVKGPKKDEISFESITCEIKDDELIYELKVPANFYRAEKLPLYYAHENAELGEGKILGKLGISQEMRVKLPKSYAGTLPEDYHLKVIEEVDRIRVNGIFNEGEYAFIVLRDEQDVTHTYHIKTTGANHEAMCVGTFLKDNPKEIEISVNKEGLTKGHYALEILCERNLYTTGIILEF